MTEHDKGLGRAKKALFSPLQIAKIAFDKSETLLKEFLLNRVVCTMKNKI